MSTAAENELIELIQTIDENSHFFSTNVFKTMLVRHRDKFAPILAKLAGGQYIAPGSGLVAVPKEPTEQMFDAGRTAVMARECSSKDWSPRQHYEACGASIDAIPADCLEGYHSKIPKGQGAMLVWYAMLAASPKSATNGGTENQTVTHT